MCGCDELTYSNACEAENNGVTSYEYRACSDSDFEENIRLWNTLNLASYSFDLSVICFCLINEPYSITVREGRVERISGSEQLGLVGIPLTIAALFNEIQNLLNQNPYQYTLEFDASYGYPKQIYLDMDSTLADEEIG